jgi:hypothetical protein
MVTKLLIDGDVICYRAAFASEKTKYLAHFCDENNRMAGSVRADDHYYLEFDDMASAKDRIKYFADKQSSRKHVATWSRKEVAPVEQALLIADVMIKDIKERYAAENPTCFVYLSGVGNFRYSIATRASYKSGRGPAPSHLKAVREHLINSQTAVVSAGEEADDLLGIAMTEFPGAVCCSIDKDLLQLPGRHYNFVSKEEVTVTKKEAVLNLYRQVISGDPTDNIPGLVGYGEVKARKALEDCKSAADCWQRAVALYTEAYGPAAMGFALETAQLVYVRRKVGDMFVPPVSTAVSAASTGTSNGEVNAAPKTEAHGDAPTGRRGRVSQRTGTRDSEAA